MEYNDIISELSDSIEKMHHIAYVINDSFFELENNTEAEKIYISYAMQGARVSFNILTDYADKIKELIKKLEDIK